MNTKKKIIISIISVVAVIGTIFMFSACSSSGIRVLTDEEVASSKAAEESKKAEEGLEVDLGDDKIAISDEEIAELVIAGGGTVVGENGETYEVSFEEDEDGNKQAVVKNSSGEVKAYVSASNNTETTRAAETTKTAETEKQSYKETQAQTKVATPETTTALETTTQAETTTEATTEAQTEETTESSDNILWDVTPAAYNFLGAYNINQMLGEGTWEVDYSYDLYTWTTFYGTLMGGTPRGLLC